MITFAADIERLLKELVLAARRFIPRPPAGTAQTPAQPLG
jgi:hypothetical protein